MARSKVDDWLTEEGLMKLEGWARDGLIDEQIAANMGVARSTLGLYKRNYPSISDALKKGKEVVDREVENALLKSAKGYYVTETETVVETYQGQPGATREKTTRKWIAGNPTSQIFWLKNRKPDVWRDKHETQISGGVDVSKRAAEIDKYLSSDNDCE